MLHKVLQQDSFLYLGLRDKSLEHNTSQADPNDLLFLVQDETLRIKINYFVVIHMRAHGQN